ncbi:hypothetical protein Mgra_00003288 [Meloidogyne graminicola]|uniref:Uncharacterized protein n=1 Tax=Meloidogyne graminicola TaxID=189291 RepID=A0A8S9ZUQ7_9BILA|nr:hypothetical protein Mgra_00003288 [Meloidogyne graminicola]
MLSFKEKMNVKHFSSIQTEINNSFDDGPPVLEIQSLSNDQHQKSNLDLLIGDDFFVENGIVYQKQSNYDYIKQRELIQPINSYIPNKNQQTIEEAPNFNSNVCCGLCGSVLTYELLINEHLPNVHPEVLANGVVDLEEIPYETWINEQEGLPATGCRSIRPGFEIKSIPENSLSSFRHVRSTRQLRRVSQYRVNTTEMTVPELELALQKKMVERMGRKVPVTLVDKLHAKCGVCDTVISLNKKFEIIHLVRHFNAWHPTAHKCAGTWPTKEPSDNVKPLSSQDFAVIDTDPLAFDNLQCIWCGMFLSSNALGMHFHEIHPEEVEVPKCNLCMQELLINARLYERFREDFGVTMPDEHIFRSIRFKRDFKSEQNLEKAIIKYLKRISEGCNPDFVDIEDMDNIEPGDNEMEENSELPSCDVFANSRMICGRRAKPKRKFITPIVRQAAPENSSFVTPITHSHWKCLLCHLDIYAAVISAGVIKHYKKFHPIKLPAVQLELCKARLDKISNRNMVIIGTEKDRKKGTCTIECQLCAQTFPMTPPFNICRAIRHIKMKHPEVMPEHNNGGGENNQAIFSTPNPECSLQQEITSEQHTDIENLIYATEITESETLEMLYNNYNIHFSKAFSISANNINQKIFILTLGNDELHSLDVEEVIRIRDPTQDPMVVVLNRTGKT